MSLQGVDLLRARGARIEDKVFRQPNTLPPTSTPVIAEATATASPTTNPATATVAAAFTQIAVSTQTVIATSTALPATGVADEFGGPGLAIMAIALIAVIFLVRRLRSAPTR